MARVIWSRRALARLHGIFVCLYEENPAVAAAVFLKLRQAADSLDIMPNGGRLISGGRRELATVAPYLIRYRVMAKGVEILEIRRAAREPQ